MSSTTTHSLNFRIIDKALSLFLPDIKFDESEDELNFQHEDSRKAMFYLFTALISIPISIGLTVFDFVNKPLVAIIVDSSFTAFLIISVLLLRYPQARKMIYRILFVLFLFVLISNLSDPSEFSSTIFFVFLLPTTSFYLMGRKEGAIWVFIMMLIVSIIMQLNMNSIAPTVTMSTSIRILITLAVMSFLLYGLEYFRDRYLERLQSSLNEIKVLRGVIPICAYCKNIRDDKGSWQHLESYVKDHSNAKFSDGICPSCMEIKYPEVQ